MHRNRIYLISAILTFILFLSGCGNVPKPATLPVSNLETPTEIIEDSAIAFQANNGVCQNSSFRISPLLEDGKYGASETFHINQNFLSRKTKKMDKNYFVTSIDHLYVRRLPPGKYAITRLTCQEGNVTYYTRPENIVIFGEFEVEAGKTNYIGLLNVGRKIQSRTPLFEVKDRFKYATPFFDEHYANRAAPLQSKLAKVRSAEAVLKDLLDLLEKLEKSEEAAKAKKNNI